MRLRIEYLPNYNRAWGDIHKAHVDDAGFDLRAATETNIYLQPGATCVIPLGIRTQFEKGYEAQVRARSGLALRNGIGLVNGVGTIDSGYRQEWACILYNHSCEPFTIRPGDRVCQVVFNKLPDVEIETGNIDDDDDRQGGFGSTGVA